MTRYLTFILMAIIIEVGAQFSFQWAQMIGRGTADVPFAVTMNTSEDSIYVLAGDTGDSADSISIPKLSRFDVYKCKGSDGSRLWSYTVVANSPSTEIVPAAIVSTTYTWVFGSTSGSLFGQHLIGGGSDYFIARFSRNGLLSWLKIFGSEDAAEVAQAMTAEPKSDNLFVTGYTKTPISNPDGSHGGITVSKLDGGNGAVVWTRIVGAGREDRSRAIAFDSGRNRVYVAGRTTGTLAGQSCGGDGDLALFALNAADGSLIWSRQVGGTGDQEAQSLVIDEATGDVYVGGTTAGSFDSNAFNGGATDGLLLRFAADGRRLWTRIFGDAADESSVALALHVNSRKVFVSHMQGVNTVVRAFDAEGRSGLPSFVGKGVALSLMAFSSRLDDMVFAGSAAGTQLGATSSGGRDVLLTRYLMSHTRRLRSHPDHV